MILMPLGNSIETNFLEAIGNTLVFGFPGFVLFIVATILSLKSDANEGIY
jgi:hypothetical protein